MPAAGRLVWDPVHLTPRISDKGEIAVLIVQHAQGRLVTLAPQRARGHAEWGIPPDVDVVAVVLGPDGLNMAKVQRLLANNDELLAQLADYAQQTSQVEALIQGLSELDPNLPQHFRHAMLNMLGNGAWTHVVVPLLVRPVWLIPVYLALLFAGISATLGWPAQSSRSTRTRS